MSEEYDVVLFVYDLSNGMAKAMSKALLGKQIDGIYHTGLVCYGYEYYYGGGIQYSRPGQSLAGNPHQIIPLGRTSKNQSQFHSYLQSIAKDFTPDKYNLITNNCNNFTSESAKFLLNGFDIPSFIIDLPNEALNTPMGQMFRPMLEQMQGNMAASSGIMPWQEGAGQSLMLPLVNLQEGLSNGTIKYGQYSIYESRQSTPAASPALSTLPSVSAPNSSPSSSTSSSTPSPATEVTALSSLTTLTPPLSMRAPSASALLKNILKKYITAASSDSLLETIESVVGFQAPIITSLCNVLSKPHRFTIELPLPSSLSLADEETAEYYQHTYSLLDSTVSTHNSDVDAAAPVVEVSSLLAVLACLLQLVLKHNAVLLLPVLTVITLIHNTRLPLLPLLPCFVFEKGVPVHVSLSASPSPLPLSSFDLITAVFDKLSGQYVAHINATDQDSSDPNSIAGVTNVAIRRSLFSAVASTLACLILSCPLLLLLSEHDGFVIATNAQAALSAGSHTNNNSNDGSVEMGHIVLLHSLVQAYRLMNSESVTCEGVFSVSLAPQLPPVLSEDGVDIITPLLPLLVRLYLSTNITSDIKLAILRVLVTLDKAGETFSHTIQNAGLTLSSVVDYSK